jgi:hypothetical protein
MTLMDSLRSTKQMFGAQHHTAGAPRQAAKRASGRRGVWNCCDAAAAQAECRLAIVSWWLACHYRRVLVIRCTSLRSGVMVAHPAVPAQSPMSLS